MEYPQMYDYINKLDPYLKKHFNKEKEWIAMKKSEEAKSLIDTIKPFIIQESLEQLEAKFKEKDSLIIRAFICFAWFLFFYVAAALIAAIGFSIYYCFKAFSIYSQIESVSFLLS